MMPDIFINTVWYIVLTAYTVSGETLHSNWSIPFENPNICGYYLKNMDPEPEDLPFKKDEMGNYVIYHGEKTYEVEFWSHSCVQFYWDEKTKKYKQVPNSI